MTALSGDAVRRYHEQGYYAPIRALSSAEAAAIRAQIDGAEARFGRLAGPLRTKPHLLFTWLDALIRHPGILDAVESVIGPDILCWGSSFFTKQAHDPAFVSWHQDATYWGLEPAEIVTAWVALTDSLADNGAMRVVPGTHRMDQMPHRDTFDPRNLLTRGQEVMVDVDPGTAVTLELQPGEMSLHHVRLVHGSDPNPSDRPRIGFAIRYMPTHVRQIAGDHDSATLVRGTDRFHHFAPERPPEADMDAAAQAFHAEVLERHAQILMRDTGKTTHAQT